MKKIKIILYATVVAAFIIINALSVAACAIGNDDVSEERGNMTIDIGEDGLIRNGTAFETYQVEQGYKGIVSISINKKSGVIDIDIYPTDRKDDTQYKGRDLDSATFSVILSETGEYKVRITAKDFVGDYEIGWKTEEKENT